MKPLNPRHVWLDLRIRKGPNYVEVFEHRPGDTTAYLLIAFGPVMLFSMAYLLGFDFDTTGLVIAIAIFLLTAGLAILNYRVPRSMRLFPEEGVAEKAWRAYGLRYCKRWKDMSSRQYVFDAVETVSRHDEESTPEIALGCLFALLGPFGLMLSPIARSLFRKKITAPAFGLRPEGTDMIPLIVISDQTQVDQIIVLLKDILKDPSVN